MKRRNFTGRGLGVTAKNLLRVCLACAALCVWSGVQAQLMDSLKNKLADGGLGGNVGSCGIGGIGGIGGAGASVSSGSMANVAGLLQFCVKNNYLGGGGVNAIKDKLTSRLPGKQPAADPAYKQGMEGILTGSNGEKMALGGDGLKDKLTKKVCEKILQQGKSLL